MLLKKSDHLLISQKRLVSLQCMDYNIFSKAIASCFSPFLKDIINMDQTYCVPDHSIHDNVSVIRDLIDVCDISHDGVHLVFLDQGEGF